MKRRKFRQFLTACLAVSAAVLVAQLTLFVGIVDVAIPRKLGSLIGSMDLVFLTMFWLALMLAFERIVGFPRKKRQLIAGILALFLLIVIYFVGHDAKLVMMSLPETPLTFRSSFDIRTGVDLFVHVAAILIGLTFTFLVGSLVEKLIAQYLPKKGQ